MKVNVKDVNFPGRKVIQTFLKELHLAFCVRVGRNRLEEIEPALSVWFPVAPKTATNGEFYERRTPINAVIVLGWPVWLAAHSLSAVSKQKSIGQMVCASIAYAALGMNTRFREDSGHAVAIGKHPCGMRTWRREVGVDDLGAEFRKPHGELV